MKTDDQNALSEWITDQIREQGPVTFAQFMEWALFHPKYGYYSTGPSIGPRGDFITSPEASPAFGLLLANHAADVDSLLEHPFEFTLIECGPGKGTLAFDFLKSCAKDHPDLYRRLRYVLVEISPGLTMTQKEHLLLMYADIVSWVESLDQLAEGTRGALIANEVVDAFPVHVLENRNGAILEQYVDNGEDDDFVPVYKEPSRPELADFLRRYNIKLVPGQKIEINLAADEWVRQIGKALQKGVATIIDYGHPQPERYSESRKAGTLLGYYAGAVTSQVLARPGQQDLTALVDFTALRDTAIAEGFSILGMSRQASFLLGLGLGTTVTAESEGPDLHSVLAYRRGLQELISPEGLGMFQVLVLGRGLDPHKAKAALSGLQYAHLV